MTIFDAIRHEHELLSARLAILKNEIDAWSHHKEPDYDLLHLLIQFFQIFPDEIHHKKEDIIYDALIRHNVLETDYLKRLKSEHDDMGALKDRFSQNLDNLAAHHVSPKWSLIIDVGKYIDFQALHMADEESQFLPLAEKELPRSRVDEIGETIQSELITDDAKQSLETLARIDADIESRLREKK